MATRKQIEANRRNAQKSTGPVTEAGKAASSLNAVKTGLYAESLIIPGENQEDLDALTAEYYTYYRPDNPDFRDLVDDLVASIWQLRRLFVTEAEIEKHLATELYRPDDIEYPRGKVAIDNARWLGAFQRRLDSARRARDRARLAIREYLRDAVATRDAIEACHAPAHSPSGQTEVRNSTALTPQALTPNWLRSENPPLPSQHSTETEDAARPEPPKAA